MASVRQQLTAWVHEQFDAHVATEILEDDAFSALAYRVRERCEDTGEYLGTILGRLNEYVLEFSAEGADNPAAYLAARVRDL